MSCTIRKPTVKDVPRIRRIIDEAVKKNAEGKTFILPRSPAELYESVRNFIVLEADGRIVGCCAVKPFWEDLGELRSLAILEDYRGRGYGKKLVEAAVEDAKSTGLAKLFTLAKIPEYFESLGFKKMDRDKLPKNIWVECTRCPEFGVCDEKALLYVIKQGPT